MPEPSETFPNYVSHEGTPALKGVGVQIAVAPGPHPLDEPLIVRGKYKIDAKLIQKSQGRPLGRVLLIVVRRDEPEVWVGPAQDVSNMAIAPSAAVSPTARQGGFFNLDLTAMWDGLTPGGEYWIMAALGDHVSDRIEFSIQQPEEKP